MKKLIVLLLIISAQLSAQSDSLFIKSRVDKMTGETIYNPSEKLKCLNEAKTKGFAVTVVIESDKQVNNLSVQTISLGACNEENELIILFEDGSKLTLKSWNQFNCKNITWFRISGKDKEQLKAKKIQSIRFTNGYTYDSFTYDLSAGEMDYFPRLFSLL